MKKRLSPAEAFQNLTVGDFNLSLNELKNQSIWKHLTNLYAFQAENPSITEFQAKSSNKIIKLEILRLNDILICIPHRTGI